MTKEGGGFIRNGEDFAGGEVRSENGSAYELALVDGRWVATYLPQDPVEVPLGESGAVATLQQIEDLTWRIAEGVRERPFHSGDLVRTEAGFSYRLVLTDNRWTANFEPLHMEIALGSSGESVTLTQREDGTWLRDGQFFQSGDGVLTEKGTAYRLVLADGGWTASFVPLRAEIALGESGVSVVTTRAENGAYLLGTAVLTEGLEYLHEASGNTYVFSQESDGSWTTSYRRFEQRVRLGRYGTVTLARKEDGTWWDGDRQVQSGDSVTARTGAAYRLRLVGSLWAASFLPEETAIASTGLVALSTESGRGYRVGESATLPESGEGDVEVGGALYRVWRQGGGLRGIRFDREPHGRSAGDANFHLGLDSGAARLGEDKPDTPENEAGTTLLVAGTEFSLGELLSTRTATVAGPSISESVATRIAGLRRQAEVLVEVLDDDRSLLLTQLRRIWDRAQTAVDRIFGPGEVKLKRELRIARVVTALQTIEAAMSSRAEFEEATAEDQLGVFGEAALGSVDAAEVFGALEWTAKAVLVAAGGTRYGAAQKMVRRDGIAAASLALDAAGAEFGAFAYSTVPDTLRTGDISHSGTAGYAGGVAAVSGAGTLYTGEIELLVDFNHRLVSGMVWNLADSQGQPWRYQLLAVDQIALPAASLGTRALWAGTGTFEAGAQIRYRSAFLRPIFATSTFKGHLLGRGEEAGSEAVGVWSVGEEAPLGSYLAGGFGATRTDARIQLGQGTVGEAGAPPSSVRPSDDPDLAGAAAVGAIRTTWGTQPSWDVATPLAGLDALGLVDVTGNHIATSSALSAQDGLRIAGRGAEHGRH